MRVFLDTNVLVSAFTSHGLCEELFRRLLRRQDTVLIGKPVLSEFERVLRQKLKAPVSDIELAVAVLERLKMVAPSADPLHLTITDKDDEPIIACALTAGADVFVTGDKELLDLNDIEGMSIVSPRTLLERLARISHQDLEFWGKLAKQVGRSLAEA